MPSFFELFEASVRSWAREKRVVDFSSVRDAGKLSFSPRGRRDVGEELFETLWNGKGGEKSEEK